MLRSLLEKRPAAPRLPYVVPGAILFFVATWLQHDGGAMWRVWPVLALLALSILGIVWPTFLGWLLLITSFAIVTLLAVLSLVFPTFGEPSLLWAGLFPLMVLWPSRPWIFEPSGTHTSERA